jgi:hypothetical protein
MFPDKAAENLNPVEKGFKPKLQCFTSSEGCWVFGFCNIDEQGKPEIDSSGMMKFVEAKRVLNSGFITWDLFQSGEIPEMTFEDLGTIRVRAVSTLNYTPSSKWKQINFLFKSVPAFISNEIDLKKKVIYLTKSGIILVGNTIEYKKGLGKLSEGKRVIDYNYDGIQKLIEGPGNYQLQEVKDIDLYIGMEIEAGSGW